MRATEGMFDQTRASFEPTCGGYQSPDLREIWIISVINNCSYENRGIIGNISKQIKAALVLWLLRHYFLFWFNPSGWVNAEEQTCLCPLLNTVESRLDAAWHLWTSVATKRINLTYIYIKYHLTNERAKDEELKHNVSYSVWFSGSLVQGLKPHRRLESVLTVAVRMNGFNVGQKHFK